MNSSLKSTASTSPEPIDGRHARSQASRARIVRAMLELVREGEVTPSASRVAERAGVGLRSVYRHFDDLEQLYREMATIVFAQVIPLVAAPYGATGVRARVGELIDRRVAIYEEIMPILIAADLRRNDSDALKNDYRRQLALERQSLLQATPQSVQDDAGLFAALEVALSFQAWRALRRDQGLSVDAAQTAVRRLANALLIDFSAD